MGLGDSEGNFSDTSFSTNVEDLMAVYNYISSNYKNPSYLIGHSLGSLVSIKAANDLDGLRALITIGSPPDFNSLIKVFSLYEKELIEKGKIIANLTGRPIKLGLKCLENLRNTNIDRIIQDFNKPIIIFHSKSDKIIPYRDSLRLFDSISSNKSFITLNNISYCSFCFFSCH